MTAAGQSIVDTLARLIEALCTADFESRLVDVAESAASSDASMSLMFAPGAAPQVLIDRLDPAERPFLYGDYLAGVYLVSPFYRAAMDLCEPAIRRLREMEPAGFRQSEYFRKYYGRIGVADLIGLLLPSGDGRVRFLSLSRKAGRQAFSAKERSKLAGLLVVMQAAALQHDHLASRPDETASESGETTRGILSSSTTSPLTEREADVVEALLAGHSEKSAARALAISAETIKVHRRHAYRKLGVATKGELFSLFVQRVRKSNP